MGIHIMEKEKFRICFANEFDSRSEQERQYIRRIKRTIKQAAEKSGYKTTKEFFNGIILFVSAPLFISEKLIHFLQANPKPILLESYQSYSETDFCIPKNRFVMQEAFRKAGIPVTAYADQTPYPESVIFAKELRNIAAECRIMMRMTEINDQTLQVGGQPSNDMIMRELLSAAAGDEALPIQIEKMKTRMKGLRELSGLSAYSQLIYMTYIVSRTVKGKSYCSVGRTFCSWDYHRTKEENINENLYAEKAAQKSYMLERGKYESQSVIVKGDYEVSVKDALEKYVGISGHRYKTRKM